MSKHFYTFDEKIYRQTKGGAIGSELTGELAKIYMLRWDAKFLIKIQQLGLKQILYKRYVDDILVMISEVCEGLKYSVASDTLVLDNDQEVLDTQSSCEAVTVRVMLEIANSIDADIQLTLQQPTALASYHVWTYNYGCQMRGT